MTKFEQEMKIRHRIVHFDVDNSAKPPKATNMECKCGVKLDDMEAMGYHITESNKV